MDHERQPRWQRIVLPLVSYVAFLVLAALSGWIALQLRAALIEIVFVRTGSPSAVSATDKWSVLVLAIAWVVGLVVLGETRRTAVQRERLRRWILLSGAVALAALLLVFGLRWILV